MIKEEHIFHVIQYLFIANVSLRACVMCVMSTIPVPICRVNTIDKTKLGSQFLLIS